MKSGAASHPEIIQRRDVISLATYDAIADIRDYLVTGKEPLPRFKPMELDFLTDALALTLEE